MEWFGLARRAAEDMAGTSARGTMNRTDPDLPVPPEAAAARKIASRHLGLLRDGDGLGEAIDLVGEIAKDLLGRRRRAKLQLIPPVRRFHRIDARKSELNTVAVDEETIAGLKLNASLLEGLGWEDAQQ